MEGWNLDVTRALSTAIRTVRSGRHDPFKAHERVKGMYSWDDVAKRTETVYERAMTIPPKDTVKRLTRYFLVQNNGDWAYNFAILGCSRWVQYLVRFFVSSSLSSIGSSSFWRFSSRETRLIMWKGYGQERNS